MIIKRIRDLREDNDITQTQIASILNVKQNTYSDYENGKLNVPVDVLIKLSQYYNVSVDYLLGLTDKKERNL